MLRQLVALLLLASASAFTVPMTSTITSRVVMREGPPSQSERGVSVDQDGKSNVWAIEPREEISSKSSEEKTQSALIAGAGFVAFAAVAAGVLSNLPDPNQF